MLLGRRPGRPTRLIFSLMPPGRSPGTLTRMPAWSSHFCVGFHCIFVLLMPSLYVLGVFGSIQMPLKGLRGLGQNVFYCSLNLDMFCRG